MSSGMQFTRGALFDLDGVLVDSLAVMRLAFEGAYRDVYGADGTDLQRLFGRFRNHLGEGLESIVAALGLSAALIPHFRRHSRALSPQVRVYPGVRDMLRALSLRGWVLGVATGKDHERADELLRALDLRQRFAVVLGCDSVPRPKPAPDMVDTFCCRTGMAARNVVMIGDAPADLRCARSGGCRSVAALWGFNTAERLKQEHPDAMAATPSGLMRLLLRLQECEA